jgi:hypothetical protein
MIKNTLIKEFFTKMKQKQAFSGNFLIKAQLWQLQPKESPYSDGMIKE